MAHVVRPEVAPTPEYLDIVDDTDSYAFPKPRKTRIWMIKSARHGYILGHIRWNNGWRQYVFEPLYGETSWSAGCLAAIVDFVAERNAEHKASRAAA